MTSRHLLATTTKQTFSMFIFTTILLSQGLTTPNCNLEACEPITRRLYRSRVLSETTDMEINPGVTKELQIQLQGQTEEILVDFKVEEADSTLFLVSVVNNKQIMATSSAQFSERETLRVTLNYDSKQANVLGNKQFSLSVPIKDSSYQVKLEKNGVTKIVTEDSFDIISNTSHDDVNNVFGVIVTIGVCILAMLVVRMILTAKKTRSLLIEDLSMINPNEDISPRRADNEAAINSKAILNHQDPLSSEKLESDLSLIKDVDVVLDDGVARKLDFDQAKLDNSKESTKKSDVNTILSTAQTLSMLPNQRMIGVGSLSNIKSVNEEGVFANSGNENFRADCHNNHRDQDESSIIIESPAISPNGTKIYTFPHKKHTEIGMDLALSMDMFEKDGKTIPTITAIKDLVRQMKQEGTIGIGNDDASVDSDDDEEQYEAPKLPNYTCCMLCFQGTRCTVVEPCRHVFACVDCTEELMDSYKICVLCANKITEYEMLSDS